MRTKILLGMVSLLAVSTASTQTVRNSSFQMHHTPITDIHRCYFISASARFRPTFAD